MKIIQLTQGKVAIVDDEDFNAVSCLKWTFKRNKGYHEKGYAACFHNTPGGKTVCILMHRFILNPPKKLMIDHINGDGLDNRRANLRVCTQQENQMFGAFRREQEHNFYLENKGNKI